MKLQSQIYFTKKMIILTLFKAVEVIYTPKNVSIKKLSDVKKFCRKIKRMWNLRDKKLLVQNFVDSGNVAPVGESRLFVRADVIRDRPVIRVSMNRPNRDSLQSDFSDESRGCFGLCQCHVVKWRLVAADGQTPYDL